MVKLAAGAIGVVFGDIGTSPLYAFRETFAGHHKLVPDAVNVLGVLSLIFWSMMLVVTIKYVSIIMRADNKGEGGSLALLALISRSTNSKRRWTNGLILLGVFATALFYGDSMITPAISVLSAVEGITVVQAGLAPMVLPIAIAILIGLFAIQSRGTAKVGLLFGPIMLVYFVVLATLGIVNILARPDIFVALNPYYAARFFATDGIMAFLAMGSVVLCCAEAGSRVPTSGGISGYVEAALGPLAGFIAGFMGVWLSSAVACRSRPSPIRPRSWSSPSL